MEECSPDLSYNLKVNLYLMFDKKLIKS